jgi:hypothetical protein
MELKLKNAPFEWTLRAAGMFRGAEIAEWTAAPLEPSIADTPLMAVWDPSLGLLRRRLPSGTGWPSPRPHEWVGRLTALGHVILRAFNVVPPATSPVAVTCTEGIGFASCCRQVIANLDGPFAG